MSQQTWKIPVSPAQRFVLLQLSFDKGQKLQGQQGRAFRRFVRAFKLDRLRDVLAENENRYNPALHSAHAPALLEITAESLEYALKLVEVARGPVEEMVVGPLFDLLEDAKAERAVDVEGVPEYDEALDDWRPLGKAALSAEEVAAEKIEAALRAAGEARAADLVASGQWDVPEPPAPPAEAGAAADA